MYIYVYRSVCTRCRKFNCVTSFDSYKTYEQVLFECKECHIYTCQFILYSSKVQHE